MGKSHTFPDFVVGPCIPVIHSSAQHTDCPVGALPINMSLANGGLGTEVKGSMNKRVKVINETKTGCSSGERFESQTFRVSGLWIQKILSGVLPALCESDRSHTGSAWAFGQSWSKAVEHSFCG